VGATPVGAAPVGRDGEEGRRPGERTARGRAVAGGRAAAGGKDGEEGRRPGERTARKGGGRRREGKAAASRRRSTLTLAGKGEHR
jgi:hypothetical protein